MMIEMIIMNMLVMLVMMMERNGLVGWDSNAFILIKVKLGIQLCITLVQLFMLFDMV